MVNIIFAPYFTKNINYHQHDSSHRGRGGAKPNDFSLIKSWYESIISLNLTAVIFHNELSAEFIEEYSNKNISFYKWNKIHRPSYNDERFYAYYEYLTKNLEIDQIISTDIFDVIFHKNPFIYVNQFSDKELFLGSERLGRSNSAWMKRKSKEMNLPLITNNYQVGETIFNAGIIGGNRKYFILLLENMIKVMNRINKNYNSNMPVFNYCVDKYPREIILSGEPFHNIFNSYKITSETVIQHK